MSGAVTAPGMARRPRLAPLAIGAGAALAALCLWAAASGGVGIPVARILAHPFGEAGAGGLSPREAAVLAQIRLPRIVLAVFVGAAVSTAGAALQGLFRNPLADPGLIGVSGGAAFAAAAAIVLGATGAFALPLAAFAGGAGATALIFVLARANGAVSVSGMLLVGIAINALSGAGIGLFSYLGTDIQLRQISLWTLGSLAGAGWDTVLPAAALMSLGTAGLLARARAMDVFVLGEREAFALGLAPVRFTVEVVLLAALAVGASVAAAGPIGFLGLVVPHMARMVLGPSHPRLMAAGLLLGAAGLVAADTLARTLAMPAEFPVGLLLSLGGAPFFLWLLRRATRSGGADA